MNIENNSTISSINNINFNDFKNTPRSIWNIIFGYVDQPQSLVSTALTCRAWRQEAQKILNQKNPEAPILKIFESAEDRCPTINNFNVRDLKKAPVEIWHDIFNFVDNPLWVLSAALTCRAWRPIAQNILNKKTQRLFYKMEEVASIFCRHIQPTKFPIAVRVVNKIDKETNSVIKIYEEIIECFKHPAFKKRWDAHPIRDDQLFSTPVGGTLVVDYPISKEDASEWSHYSIKLVHLLKLRDLLHFGPEILDVLKKQLFLSKKKAFYQPVDENDMGKGMESIKDYAQNFLLVDLVSSLGNCSGKEPLKIIEMARQRIAMFIEEYKEHFGKMGKDFVAANREYDKRLALANNDESSNSEIIYQKNLAILFELYRLNLEERNLYVDPYRIEVLGATAVLSGRTGLCLNQWNNHYYVNVPATGDVVNSLIRIPYLLANSYILLKTHSSGPDDLQNKLLDFFDRSLPIKCYSSLLEAVENFYKECRSKYLKKETLAEKVRKKAIETFGIDKVQEAEENSLMNYIEFFIEDDEILPPENSSEDKNEWMFEALPKYIQKAKDQGLWKNKVFYRDSSLNIPLPGNTYSLFDEEVIKQLMQCWTLIDCEDRIEK